MGRGLQTDESSDTKTGELKPLPSRKKSAGELTRAIGDNSTEMVLT